MDRPDLNSARSSWWIEDGTSAPRIIVPSHDACVGVEEFGMHYSPENEKVVEHARAVADETWDALKVMTLAARTPLEANVETIHLRYVARVVNGDEPFRDDHIMRLLRASDGKLHIVDGHARAAMYYVLDRPMPVLIMD